ncbi:putative AC transposase [Bienertia sinuspersici]
MLLGGSLMHVRCCAPILNLCVHEGIGEIGPLLEPIRGVIRRIRVEKCNRRRYPTRWKLTYKLLYDVIAFSDVLIDVYNGSQTDGQFITNDHWSLSMIIHDILETFDNATHIFSYVYAPNIYKVILE